MENYNTEAKEKLQLEELSLLKEGDTVFEIDTYTNNLEPCVVECVVTNIFNENDDIYFEIQAKDNPFHDNVIALSHAPYYLFFSEKMATAYAKHYGLKGNSLNQAPVFTK